MKLGLRKQIISIALIVACLGSFLGCGSSQSNSNTQPNRNSAATSPNQTSSTSITGSSFQDDAVGDVLDGNYRKPRQALPGIDLASTRIEFIGSDLKVTFTANSDFQMTIPPDQSAVWHINACTPDGNRCCLFGAKVVGSEWMAYISEMSPARNTYVNAPMIKGNELIVMIPQDKLPGWMRNPFKWWADSEWGGKWSDRIPNEGKDILNATTIPFPKS